MKKPRDDRNLDEDLHEPTTNTDFWWGVAFLLFTACVMAKFVYEKITGGSWALF